MRSGDLVGRIVGGILFLAGVGILVFVFVLAYGYFNSPNSGVAFAPANATTPATSQLGASAIVMLVRIGLLIVMALVGSLLAGRGMQFYLISSTPAAPSPVE